MLFSKSYNLSESKSSCTKTRIDYCLCHLTLDQRKHIWCPKRSSQKKGKYNYDIHPPSSPFSPAPFNKYFNYISPVPSMKQLINLLEIGRKCFLSAFLLAFSSFLRPSSHRTREKSEKLLFSPFRFSFLLDWEGMKVVLASTTCSQMSSIT